MKTFEFKHPDGRVLSVDSPDGSMPSEQEIDAMFAQGGKQPEKGLWDKLGDRGRNMLTLDKNPASWIGQPVHVLGETAGALGDIVDAAMSGPAVRELAGRLIPESVKGTAGELLKAPLEAVGGLAQEYPTATRYAGDVLNMGTALPMAKGLAATGSAAYGAAKEKTLKSLDDLGQTAYRSAIKARTSKDYELNEDMVRTLRLWGVPVGDENVGNKQLNLALGRIGEMKTNILKSHTLEGRTISPDYMIDNLEKVKQELLFRPIPETKQAATVQMKIDALKQSGEIPIEVAEKQRRVLAKATNYGSTVGRVTQTTEDSFKDKMLKAQERGLSSGIVDQAPELAQLNEQSHWLNLAKEDLNKAANRERNLNMMPMRASMGGILGGAMGYGAGGGPAGGTAGILAGSYLGSKLDSAATKTALANWLSSREGARNMTRLNALEQGGLTRLLSERPPQRQMLGWQPMMGNENLVDPIEEAARQMYQRGGSDMPAGLSELVQRFLERNQ